MPPIDAKILIADDNEDVLQAARLLLKRHFTGVQTLSDPAHLASLARRGTFDVLLLDMNFSPGADSGAEGLSRLSEVLEIDPQAVVVMVTAHGDLELAVEAMKRGASDFITKPWENERLVATLTAALNLSRSRQEASELRQRHSGLAAATNTGSGMIGTSPAMLRVFGAIRRTAPTDANVLILGENGTGKELAAREIHRLSPRGGQVFLRVDMGALSPQLFESELFGHRRGAFTDAKQDRTGYFRAATGGTLFLDEIGNVPLALQSKLLTALERREVVPVGAEKPEPIDVRLVCATNLSRERLVDENLFRQDLLYRINTVELTMPPLRERPEDVALLLEHYTGLYLQKYNLPPKRLSAALIDRLSHWSWPGNVRALRHAVERAVILSEGEVLDVGDFPLTETARDAAPPAAGAARLDAVEKATIEQALARANNNVSRAAEMLGLTRASLYRRMENMAFSGLQQGILVRVMGLLGTLALLAWMVVHTSWYVTIALCVAAALAQMMLLTRYAARASREISRFLDAIAFDDTSATFSGFSRQSGFGELGLSMNRVLDQLRIGRKEREEQAQYLQNLIAHIPVALMSLDEHGSVQLLNLASRRLFAGPCESIAAFSRYGLPFATALENLKPGQSAIVRMDRASGSLQLKVAATDVVLSGVRRRLISLQNIESELTAHELMAWQTVIRVMAHEVMNSLTPISSLAATARDRLDESLAQLPPGEAVRPNLEDASEALETLARRSDGLLHFVQNHRRLTRRFDAQLEIVPVRRVFSRLQRLLADELTTRDITLVSEVTPETLEVSVDPGLLDQALINLVRNAMEALRDTPAGKIALSASQDGGGRPVIAVADNGPGISPEQREKVFVPFYTTKRQGSGVGLTLVRQIATVHGASVGISDTPGGGTTVSIRF